MNDQAAPIEQIKAPKDVPRHEIPLPSMGLVYPKGYALADRKHVLIRAMTIKDEDILSSEPLIKKKQAINEFVKSALGQNIDLTSMLPGDREAIMHAFRATGYGTDYKVKITCPNCDERFKYNFDLKSLKINSLGVQPLQPNTNLFELPEKLPHSDATIQFSLMTIGMETEIATMLRNMGKEQQLLPEHTLRLTYQVQSVNGDSDKGKVRSFVESMMAIDSHYLRKYIKRVTPGVDTKQKMECPFCDSIEEVMLPMDVSFFFPED